jgi:DNA-binding LacI/PurR family transcriptional regulator
MQKGMQMERTEAASRSSARLSEVLRDEIVTGGFLAGHLMPGERTLAREHGVSPKTARRALKLLEAQGLLAAESRRGYRVMSKALDPERGCPLAFVVSADGSSYAPFHRSLLDALQRSASISGWSMLGIGIDHLAPAEILERLRGARACAAIVDAVDQGLVELIAETGIPVVMVNSPTESLIHDSVVQDGFMGGFSAGQWLAGRGHSRIAFIGPQVRGGVLQIVERYSGAVGGLAREGLGLAPDMEIAVPLRNREAAVAAARKLLERSDRPTGILALWQGVALAVGEAAASLGMTVGRDFDMVGWFGEEDYGADYLSSFGAGGAPATVVWSEAEMAEACIARVLQRRENRELKPLTIKIPTKLKIVESLAGVNNEGSSSNRKESQE